MFKHIKKNSAKSLCFFGCLVTFHWTSHPTWMLGCLNRVPNSLDFFPAKLCTKEIWRTSLSIHENFAEKKRFLMFLAGFFWWKNWHRPPEKVTVFPKRKWVVIQADERFFMNSGNKPQGRIMKTLVQMILTVAYHKTGWICNTYTICWTKTK